MCPVSPFELTGTPQLEAQVMGPCPVVCHWESPSRSPWDTLQLCSSLGREVAPTSLPVLICVMETAGQCLRAGGGSHPAQSQLSGKIQGGTGGGPVRAKAKDQQGIGRLPFPGSQRAQEQTEHLPVAPGWRGVKSSSGRCGPFSGLNSHSALCLQLWASWTNSLLRRERDLS